MSSCFNVCRSFQGATARTQVILDGLDILTCLAVVMSKHFRLALAHFRELLFEHTCDPSMQSLTRAPQQARICCILDEGMFEGVGHFRPCATAERLTRVDQPVQ